MVRRSKHQERTHEQDRHHHCRAHWTWCGIHRSGEQPRAALHHGPGSQWLSLEALKAKAEAQGYKVQKAKIKAAAARSTPSTGTAPAPSCSSIRPRARSSRRMYAMTASRSGRSRRRDAGGNGRQNSRKHEDDGPRLGSVRPDLPLEPRRPVRPRLRDRGRDRVAAHRRRATPSRLSSRCGSCGASSVLAMPGSATSSGPRRDPRLHAPGRSRTGAALSRAQSGRRAMTSPCSS